MKGTLNFELNGSILNFNFFNVRVPKIEHKECVFEQPFISFYWPYHFRALESEKHLVLGIPLEKIPIHLVYEFLNHSEGGGWRKPKNRKKKIFEEKILVKICEFFSVRNKEDFREVIFLLDDKQTIIPIWILFCIISARETDTMLRYVSNLLSDEKEVDYTGTIEAQLMMTKAEAELFSRRMVTKIMPEAPQKEGERSILFLYESMEKRLRDVESQLNDMKTQKRQKTKK